MCMKKLEIKQLSKLLSVKDVPDETIIRQFRKFLEGLEQKAKKKGEADQDSKDLITLFLKKSKSCAKK